jgi:2-iminobutanoate/2-iminopropanoate deaminase
MAIKREKIQPKGIHVRMMAGQPAYTQVVTVSGTGRQIFVAGQLARDADGNCVGKGDMRAQIQQVGENIKACLEAAGATLADIVKTNTYVTDFEEFSKRRHADALFRRRHADQHDGRSTPPCRPQFHDRDRGDRLRRQLTAWGTLPNPPPLAGEGRVGRCGGNANAIINDFVMVNSPTPLISPRFNTFDLKDAIDRPQPGQSA